jgi:hypothetical protein
MGKYEPLARKLQAEEQQEWSAGFVDIERLLGFRLPASARRYRSWWGNQSGAGHSQARGWQDAGWHVWKVDLDAEQVTFRRVGGEGERRAAERGYARLDKLDDLLRQAGEITGIADRELLIREAVRGLIAREAAQRLARLGGTMPDIEVPPRQRPSL